MTHTGILLTNTGTPTAPTRSAVRQYLREFLSDERIVQLPRLVWLPILFGIILPFRTKRSAALYKTIWQDKGSPLRFHMEALANRLQQLLNQNKNEQYTVKVGMNYGEPSIASALKALENAHIDTLITLPLFPQYSNTSTAGSHDRLMNTLATWKALPHHFFIRDYAGNTAYIDALKNKLLTHWQTHQKAEHLLLSFHGIPKRFVAKGDPYPLHCEKTAMLLTEALGLKAHDWTLCYQSSFGYDKWLEPATHELLKALPKRGIQSVDVCCPGFSVDCLETLEEIAIKGKDIFLQAGGQAFQYCAALNDECDYLLPLINSYLESL